MKWISEEDLKEHIIRDNCDEGCGYIDERDIIDMEWVEDDKFIPCYVLDKIRAEMEQIKEAEYQIYGKGSWRFVGKCLDIIDKYKTDLTGKKVRDERQ